MQNAEKDENNNQELKSPFENLQEKLNTKSTREDPIEKTS
jgi:hypothetical protein